MSRLSRVKTENVTNPYWVKLAFRPVDNAGLTVFRIAFGLSIAAYALKTLTGGLIEYHYLSPAFHFSYYGSSWVQPWPGIGMYVHLGVLAGAAICFAAGLFYRFSSLLMFVSFTYVFLLERTLYNNHYYLMSLLALLSLFIPLQQRWSLDAWWTPEIASSSLSAWTLWLLRFQIGIVYFYGGVAKFDSDWLRGQPMRMRLDRLSPYPVLGAYFTEEWVVQTFVWGGLLIDLLAVPLLLWRRTRTFAFCMLLVFHGINATLFHIGVFPWLMIAATTLFFAPDWPCRLLRIQIRRSADLSTRSVRWDRHLVVGATLVLLYVSFQLLFPLRQHLYQGPASWTERGHYFSWRMMLRDKHGAVRVTARNPQTGQEGVVDLRNYLSLVQLSKIVNDPDSLLQLAHLLAENFRQRGLGETEIRVEAVVSLNGRKPQLMIDPDVNLAEQRRGWQDYPWILPLTEPLRHHAWERP